MIKSLFVVSLFVLASLASTAAPLDDAWANQPIDARLRSYWWWLNANVTKAAITQDLEGMKAKGFAGAVLFDAGGASQDGNDDVPAGPCFGTPAWRELYLHTLREASRLGLEISLNMQSGWNVGGPMVTADDAPKKLVWTEQRVTGGKNVSVKVPQPKAKDGYYRDLFVLAWRGQERASAFAGLSASSEQSGHGAKDALDGNSDSFQLSGAAGPLTVTDAAMRRPPMQNQKEKALLKALVPSSAPKTDLLFADFPAAAGEEDARADGVLDLTSMFDANSGTLAWDAPAGDWIVLRLGCTLNDHCRVSTCSKAWEGYALDPFDAGAFIRYWDAAVEPLLTAAGPMVGKTLKYLHTDSWEVEVANWTPTLREEFKKRRGYDLLNWLPVVTGHIVNNRDQSNRFLHDFRKTMGDLAIDNHYRIFRDRAHQHGLLIHPESGGPHAVPIDAQRCLGWDDAPMSEFWAWSWKHRIGDDNRFFVKQPASAAHTYGRKLVFAEGFTTIGPHWQERLCDNLKPAFDKALCEGLNVLVWHAFVCSPDETGIPGQQYFAGTHLNPKVTWWSRSDAFFTYINRCQAMLQQGLFAADVAYYYGDHVPNFTQHKSVDPAHVRPGYDYDVLTEENMLTRVAVRDGRIVLPDGMSYRVLVLPDRTLISLPVLRKLKELVVAGATVVGPKPAESGSLQDFPQCDAEIRALADELWGGKTGKGRVITGKAARELLLADGIQPDCELASDNPKAQLDYIHRTADGAEIYFVANRAPVEVDVRGTFRVTGRVPELWDAVSGGKTFAAAYSEANGRTTLPLTLPPCGSMFVVFRAPAAAHPATASDNRAKFATLKELAGPWTVKFDPNWGGPAAVEFATLTSWTERADPGIKYYSGTATYVNGFIRPAATRVWLDLGDVRELAEVRVNGKPCGIVWTTPFRVEVTGALKPGENTLEVDVVNFWPNRIIGDACLPKDKPHFTQTNVRKLTAKTELTPSGLLGPVRLLKALSVPLSH
ncbi:MAG: glycosyl hydrolase [bacterium]